MSARWVAGVVVVFVAGCGDNGPSGPGPDPGPPDPVFDDNDNRVTITEGEWRGVGDPWAGAGAWFTNTSGLMTEVAREGACRLLASDVMYCEGCEGWCVDGGTCIEWPANRSAGTITFVGLAVPLQLIWQPGAYYSQSEQPPDDVFDAGDPITVTADGDVVAGFSASITGVASIDPDLGGACANELHIVRGEDFTVTWADPQPGARVKLRLPSQNNGHGMPPIAAIECDGQDTGALVVPAALIDGLPDLVPTNPCDGGACEGFDCPPATVARYSRAAVTAGTETIAVRAEAAVSFYLSDE